MVRSRRALLSVLVLVGSTLVGSGEAVAHPDPGYPPPVAERFQKVVLEDADLTQPMRIAVAGDGRVVYIERDGRVKVWNPGTQASITAGTVPVRVTGELGLVGLALAPDFDTTGHLYLHFSPPEWDQTFVSRISRFTLTGTALDVASETRIIDIQHPAGVVGWHSAGDLLMTPDGQLFVATGDNSDCCASNGFPPTDERPGREIGDAQRTSANTNDLNGKVLRITPRPEGGYDIPPGNLFPPGTDKTRPEIYAMGFRNPFTLGDWDPATGTLWMADYGPDAVQPNPARGPAGHVRALLVRGPGNYGWPYCTMDNVPYNDWNYATNAPGPWFDCAAPVNDSPNNTGLVHLPPITPADIYYTYDKQAYFPELYGGGAMAGPRYTYDPANPSPTKFPQWFDGQRFLYDWTTDWIRTLPVDHHTGAPGPSTEFLPATDFRKPMDLEFGPDGSLYVLEYGNGWGSSNDDSGLYRIDYVEGNRAPAVTSTSTVDSGPVPLTAGFDASASVDPDGDALRYSWDFTGDGVADAAGPAATWTFTEPGQHNARVTVTDAHGAVSVGNVPVTAGNTRPSVVIESPADGGWSEFGDALPFRLRVTDPEDGAVDCTKVVVTYQLGHNQHGHPQAEATPGPDCTGVLTPVPDAGHGKDTYVFHILGARYTDGGAPGAPALTGSSDVVLHPREYQGRNYPLGSGVGLYFGQLFVPDSGNWFSFPRISLAGIDHLAMEFATRQAGANLTVHADSPTGPVVATFGNVPHTGSTSLNDRVYSWLAADVTDPGGVHDLYFVADWPEGVQPELFVRFFRFQTVPEVTAAVPPPAASGWHTTPPAVSATAAPFWTPQLSLDGTTWSSVPVTLPDGVHEVRYRAVDAAGRSSVPGAVGVRVDTVAPVVSVPGGPAGHASALAIPVADQGSGLATATATVDGVPVTAPVELWRHPAGRHTLTVTAVDVAGNRIVHEVPLEITTSLAELRPLVDRFPVPFVKRVAMVLQLMAATRAHDAGRVDEAVTWLRHFRFTASTLRDPEARETLTADAGLVITQLRGD